MSEHDSNLPRHDGPLNRLNETLDKVVGRTQVIRIPSGPLRHDEIQSPAEPAPAPVPEPTIPSNNPEDLIAELARLIGESKNGDSTPPMSAGEPVSLAHATVTTVDAQPPAQPEVSLGNYLLSAEIDDGREWDGYAEALVQAPPAVVTTPERASVETVLVAAEPAAPMETATDARHDIEQGSSPEHIAVEERVATATAVDDLNGPETTGLGQQDLVPVGDDLAPSRRFLGVAEAWGEAMRIVLNPIAIAVLLILLVAGGGYYLTSRMAPNGAVPVPPEISPVPTPAKLAPPKEAPPADATATDGPTIDPVPVTPQVTEPAPLPAAADKDAAKAPPAPRPDPREEEGEVSAATAEPALVTPPAFPAPLPAGGLAALRAQAAKPVPQAVARPVAVPPAAAPARQAVVYQQGQTTSVPFIVHR
jgi:hypothetical protein